VVLSFQITNIADFLKLADSMLDQDII